ncbi:MAG: ShlB/FhaC/HecB family hemolysin secretion/activation protein, partial [Spartobacteria bacterium]|nr:ShlB/FhaC/HecB family hemolysin secretion/activation protein [Spartobacteria bacterium]
MSSTIRELRFLLSMIHKVNDPFQKLATAGIIARFAALAFAVNGAFLLNASGQMEEPPPLEEVVKSIDAGRPETFYIREFRIVGAKKLPQDDVDAAVYNRLGKGRTPEDVEGARVALEKAYHDKGYQTVSVTVPPQSVTSGVIVMQVSEVTVGRLTVKGSRFFDIEKIKKMAPSLAEGNVPNFNDIQQDIMGLNQQADCQVTPSLTAGKIPGTVDVELTVKDKFPLHGSVELNNRYSANTTPLRLDAAVRYDNLWQWGHTIGGAFQIAPQRPSDALIYSGYYIARTPSIDWLSLMLSATRQNSEVSTLGGSSSLGNGEIYGGKFLVNLPSKKGFYHSASLGLDYKDFAQDLVVNDQIVSSPLTYWPFSLNYNASSIGKHYQTEFNAGVTFAFRGTGTEEAIDFDNRRYNASANFFYLRGGIEHTQKLAWDFQIVGGLQGQATANPLVDTEQFSLGGLSTVRGYLESSVVGDNAVCGTLELRTPSLLGWLPEGNEWRFFAFIDAGYAMLNDPLPEQVDHFTLWSIGVGTSLRLIEHVNGEFLIGIPQVTQSPSQAGQPLFTF